MAHLTVRVASSEPLAIGSEESNFASRITAMIANMLESEGVGNLFVKYNSRVTETIVEDNRKSLRFDTTVTP